MKITIPKTITHLTHEVLDTIINNEGIRLEDLDEIHIPGSVKTIGELAFKDCRNLKRVTLKEGLQSIGNCAFRETAIEAITIPGSVKTIGNHAFRDCPNLKHVTLEEGVQRIGMCALYGTSIEIIIIPKSAQEIGSHMLGRCLRLEVVILPVTHAKRGSYSGTLGVWSSVQVIVTDNLKQLVQETLNTYNNTITIKEHRLALQHMSRYSTQQLYTIWHLLTNKQTITDEQECLMFNRVVSMSCDDALNIAKQFPSIMHFSVQLQNSLKNVESLQSKMVNALGRDKQVLEVCWRLINDLHLKRASLAWISPFLTLKEVARVIITMLSCKHGQAQIINSLEGQAVAAISIGVGHINASMDQATESASNNLVSSMGGSDVVQTGQEHLVNTKLGEDEADIANDSNSRDNQITVENDSESIVLAG